MILHFRLSTPNNCELKTIHTTRCDISLIKQKWSSGKVASQSTDLKKDATENFYNTSGDIFESNCSEQREKIITWADPIDSNGNYSVYTISSLQILWFNCYDSSGYEYSYSTRDDISIDILDNKHSIFILQSHGGDDSSSNGDSSVASFDNNGFESFN